MTSRSKRGVQARRGGAGPVGGHDAAHRFATRYRKWSEAVARLAATIERLKSEPQPMGAKWAANQVAYFERRLEELKGYEPRQK